MNEKPFSSRTLAERWGCSSAHIVNMIKRGELNAFTIGREYRIPHKEVERVENCNLNSTGGNGASTDMTEEKLQEPLYVPPTVELPNNVTEIR